MNESMNNMLIIYNKYLYNKNKILGLSFFSLSTFNLTKYFILKDLNWLWFVYMYALLIINNVNYNTVHMISKYYIVGLFIIMIISLIDFFVNKQYSKLYACSMDTITTFMKFDNKSNKFFLLNIIISIIHMMICFSVVVYLIRYAVIYVFTMFGRYADNIAALNENINDVNVAVLIVGITMANICYLISTNIFTPKYCKYINK